jgi:hypothetical protein
MSDKNIEFLRAVLPSDGYVCIANLAADKVMRQNFAPATNMSLICQYIKDAANLGRNVYFTPNAFGSTARLALQHYLGRCLYLDLDIDPNEPSKYASLDAAKAGFLFLLQELQMPSPTYVIRTGYGLHMYWVMTTDLKFPEWHKLAVSFKAACTHVRSNPLSHFLFDATVPADAARVLRVPGTYNYRDPANPKPCRIISEGRTHDYTYLAQLLAPYATPDIMPVIRPAYMGAPTDTTASISADFKPSHFVVIGTKTQQGTGCTQLAECVKGRQWLPEPMWRAALSIANKCVDRDSAIALVSLDHADYTAHAADKKAAETAGPYTCGQFNNLNPGICHTCPNWGRITSPIALGVTATPIANTVVIHANSVDYIINNEIPNATTNGALPWPYYRTQQGLYKELSQEDAIKAVAKNTPLIPVPGNPNSAPCCVKIFDYDFALTAVGYDNENNEEVYGLSVKLPKDPLRTQTLTSSNLKASDKFRTHLHMGAGIADYEINNLRDLVIRSVKHVRQQQQASEVVRQLGWTPRNTFCFGQYELHGDGTITTVINRPEMRQLMSAVRVSGDPTIAIDAFKSMSAFWSTPGYEYGAMALATTFAAPLLHIGGVISGGVVHCYSALSGRGKSAIQLACLSVWGDSDKLIALPSDTDNSTMHHINMLGSLPMAIEEITKMSVEDTGAMVYQLTHGREKRRMDGATYTNKAPMGNYRTLTITSGNASLLDKAMAGNTSPDGIVYRILEVQMDRELPASLDMESLLLCMTRNYGAVGAHYIAYVVTHQKAVLRMITEAVDDMEATWGISKHERYWREIMAYMLVGMTIANQLNIASFDLVAMRAWIKAWYISYRDKVVKLLSSGRDILVSIVARNVRDTVFVLSNGVVTMAPGGNGQISYDHRSKELWIAAALLHTEVIKSGGDISGVTTAMTSPTFKYLGTSTMALADGLLTGMAVNVATNGYKYKVLSLDTMPPNYATEV